MTFWRAEGNKAKEEVICKYTSLFKFIMPRIQN